jgi:D-alanyl-D-alanine carboxypeptidase
MGTQEEGPIDLVVINKTDRPRDPLGSAEKVVRLFSLAAIPVVLAIGGWVIQARLQNQTVSRDYVQLAISILREPAGPELRPEIRGWATDVLAAYSPTTLNEAVLQQLRSGSTTLPVAAPDSQRLAGLHPAVATLAQELLQRASERGIALRISRGYVSFEEQNALYSRGRTTPGPRVTNARGGQSVHNFGIAFDVVPIVGGKVAFDRRDLFETVGAIGRELGLTWGGDWKQFRDLPHFQLEPPDPKQIPERPGGTRPTQPAAKASP